MGHELGTAEVDIAVDVQEWVPSNGAPHQAEHVVEGLLCLTAVVVEAPLLMLGEYEADHAL